MKIAIEILKYFAQGGVQRDMRFTAEALARRGAEVTVLAECAEAGVPAGCKLVTLPATGFSNHARAHNFAGRAADYLAEHPADAVMGFNRLPGLDLYFAGDDALAMRWCNPFVNRFLPRRRTFLTLEKAVFADGGAKKIFTMTARQERDYTAGYGTAPERYFRVGPGVSRRFQSMDRSPEARRAARARFGVLPETFFIVQAAANFSTKGVDRLLDVVEHLPGELRSQVAVAVAGGGKEAERYRENAERCNLPVSFIGTTDDMPGLLAGADLMFHAARAESAGGVIPEALVAGVPVLTTELCGYADFVKEAHGGVVLPEPFEEARWRDTLEWLLRAPERMAEFRAELADVWRDEKWYTRNEVMADEILKFAAEKKDALR